MTRRRVLASAVLAVLIGASVLAVPFMSGGADAQPQAAVTVRPRLVIPELAADRDVGDVRVTVSQHGTSAALDLSLALDEAERERGLMWITTMPEDTGMLFVFPFDTTVGFWMKNTYLPLDIAFISSQGVLLNIQHGVPLDTTALNPFGAYRYVVEANAGWFADHGFSSGAQVTLPADLPKAS